MTDSGRVVTDAEMRQEVRLGRLKQRAAQVGREIDQILGGVYVGFEPNGYMDTRDAADFLQNARDLLRRPGDKVVIQRSKDYLIARKTPLPRKKIVRLSRLEEEHHKLDSEIGDIEDED